MELGNQMKKYRGELSLSQDALAEKIYVSNVFGILVMQHLKGNVIFVFIETLNAERL